MLTGLEGPIHWKSKEILKEKILRFFSSSYLQALGQTHDRQRDGQSCVATGATTGLARNILSWTRKWLGSSVSYQCRGLLRKPSKITTLLPKWRKKSFRCFFKMLSDITFCFESTPTQRTNNCFIQGEWLKLPPLLNFLSTRSYQNWLKISISAKIFKGICYLKNLGRGGGDGVRPVCLFHMASHIEYVWLL